MKLLLLFTLIVTTQAGNLRQDATLFRMEPQEAKVQRSMEAPNECNICQNIVAVMQNSVTKDGSLYQYSKLEEFKTLARHACHGYRGSPKAEKECLAIVDNTKMLMDHLYDRNPSTCEVMEHCKRCRPCPSPAECYICDVPDSHELNLMDMIHTSWQSFKEWFPFSVNHSEYDEDLLGF